MSNRFSFRRSAARALTLSAMVALALTAGPLSANAGAVVGSAQCGPSNGKLWIPTDNSSLCTGCTSATLPCYQTNPQAPNCPDKDPIDFPSDTAMGTDDFLATFLFNSGSPFVAGSIAGSLTMVLTSVCPASTTTTSPSPCVQAANFTGTVVAVPSTGSVCPLSSIRQMTLDFSSGALANCQMVFCSSTGTNIAGKFSATGETTVTPGAGVCRLAGAHGSAFPVPIPNPDPNTTIVFNCQYNP